MRGNSFHIKEDKKYVEFIQEPAKNAFVLANKKVSAEFKADHFKYHVAPLVNAKGHARVDLNKVDIEIGIAFDTTVVDESGHIIPHVTAVDVKCDISRHDIKIHLFGNLLTDIGSLFEVFFKGTVAKEIEKTINLALNTGVPTVTNKILHKMDGELKIPVVQNWIIDWQTQDPVQIKDTWFGFGARGLFFDSTIGREEFGTVPEAMTYKDSAKPEKFQNWLSAYTINSFLNSLTEVIKLDFVVKAETIKLTCGELVAVLPGIAQTYGADSPVDVKINIHTLHDFQSIADNQEMKMQTSFDLAFWVHTTDGQIVEAAGLQLDDVKLGFQALTKDMNLTLALTQLNVGKVSVLNSTIGKLSPVQIKLEINNGFRIAKPIINGLLAAHPIPFPTNVFGLFNLEAMTLDYYDDYIYAGITPVFVGPSRQDYQEVPALHLNERKDGEDYLVYESFEFVQGDEVIVVEQMEFV